MRSRPWPLVLIAIIHLLTPVFNIMFNAAVLKISPFVLLDWLLTQNKAIDVIEALAIAPVAGLAIFAMKRWSYPVFWATTLYTIYSNYRQVQSGASTVSFPIFLGITAMSVAIVTYFLLPAVRRTYFDPRVRWWESKPRYPLAAPAALEIAGARHTGSLLNISEGGAFATLVDKLAMGSKVKLAFDVLSQHFDVVGRIVHVRETQGQGYCYGIEFDHTPETERRIHGLAVGLAAMGFNDRGAGKAGWGESFSLWLRTLLKTGRGFTPKIDERR